MRLSTRLIRNAVTTYARLGTTFLVGLFTTWYTLGAVGMVGFGLMALAVSSTGLSRAIERALRAGLLRELAAAVAGGDPRSIRCSLTSAFRLCLEAVVPLVAFVVILAALAWADVFNLPADQPGLRMVLVILILAEGIHAVARLLCAPWIQLLLAAQMVTTDNLLITMARVTYALSAVVVFGWILADASLASQLTGFAISRVTLQLADLALGIFLAKRHFPEVRLERAAFDEGEYRAIRDTVWNSSQVSLLMNLNPQFLAILINLFFGLTYNGVWQIVVQFAGFARMFSEGLLHGIAPLATHLQERGRSAATVDLMTRSIRFQHAVALPSLIFLGLWARPLLDLWVGRRLANDANLATAGVSAEAALTLAATMTTILLVVLTLRSSYFGVEQILYGMGKVRSYAWFSKWATLIVVGGGGLLMAWFRDPIVAPIALLVGYFFFSPTVILRAARREAGLSVAAALSRSLPRPILCNILLLGLLVPVRIVVTRLTPVSFVALLSAAGIAYSALGFLMIFERAERARLLQMRGEAVRWILGRKAPEDDRPPRPN